MHTLVFFDRGGLTVLFAKLTDLLKNDYRIIHVAYSNAEKSYMETHGISCDYVLKDYIYAQYDNIVLQTDRLNDIDADIRKYSDGRFTLNSAIQSDRTFAGIGYEHALRLSLLYYQFWEFIYSSNNVSYTFHEPTSLFMNHIACIVGKKYGSIYTYFLHADNDQDKNGFRICNYDDGSSIEFSTIFHCITDDDVAASRSTINAFVTKFTQSYNDIANSDLFVHDNSTRLFLLGLVSRYLNIKRYHINNPNCDLLDEYLNEQSRSYRLRQWTNKRKYRKIQFSEPIKNEKYYYYSMHLEPEAVVLYWGDGIYKGQVKLIENIAAQLPAGIYLYVKDHPHIIGYRNVSDYEKIQSIPNVRLIRSNVPGKLLIRDAIGVFSINGTAALEAALLRKESYIFGNVYFDDYKGITKVNNIKDLSAILQKERPVINDKEYDKFILAYLKSIHIGYADFTGGEKRLRANPISTSQENINNIAATLKLYIDRYHQ